MKGRRWVERVQVPAAAGGECAEVPATVPAEEAPPPAAASVPEPSAEASPPTVASGELATATAVEAPPAAVEQAAEAEVATAEGQSPPAAAAEAAPGSKEVDESLRAPPGPAPCSRSACQGAAKAAPLGPAPMPASTGLAAAQTAEVTAAMAVGAQPGLHKDDAVAGSGEMFLMEMLAVMDHHSSQLREAQQRLVATVELACRRALGHHFGRLVLVGSAALRVETPGSDVDVVCFTRNPGGREALGMNTDVLRRVYGSLQTLIHQYSHCQNQFSMELIEDARVPILRVLWDHMVAVDVSVDLQRPVDHVRWFQRVGAAPRPTSTLPPVAPLVTLTLRCVKWWLRQRQIPRTKEGGLPTLAWLLMAVHVCSLKETHDEAWPTQGSGPMAALLSSLTAFFRYYGSLERLDGALHFEADGTSSNFRLRTKEERVDAWAQLSVHDPTQQGFESLDLVPRLRPATQLLLACELRRASHRLEATPRGGSEATFGEARQLLQEVFDPLPEGATVIPCQVKGKIPSLVLWGGGTVPSLRLAYIEAAMPRPGWNAPFLHRWDERSEVKARLVEVEAYTGHIRQQKKPRKSIVIRPADFVCQVHVEKDGKNYRLRADDLERLAEMQRELEEVKKRAVVERTEPAPSTTAPSSVRSNASTDSRSSSTAAASATLASTAKEIARRSSRRLPSPIRTHASPPSDQEVRAVASPARGNLAATVADGIAAEVACSHADAVALD